MLTSGNGWQASDNQKTIGIKSYRVKGAGIKLRCAQKVAPLLVGFAARQVLLEQLVPILHDIDSQMDLMEELDIY